MAGYARSDRSKTLDGIDLDVYLMVSKIYEESIAKDNPHIKKDQDDKGRPMGSVDWVTVRVRGEERCMAKLPRTVTRTLLIHPEVQNIVRSLVYEGKFNEAMSLSQEGKERRGRTQHLSSVSRGILQL